MSNTGNLTLRAISVTVKSAGIIAVAATGTTLDGKGASGTSTDGGMACGTYYGAGVGGTYAWGSAVDAEVNAGSPGGIGGNSSAGGHGGGVLRLIANTINIAGALTANGEDGASSVTVAGGGAGSGGGILIAADSLVVTGSISAAGGMGGSGVTTACYNSHGGAGGLGRVKLLYGANKSVSGTIVGMQSTSPMPPMWITSSSHPDPTLVYNDGFALATFTWNRPYPSAQGYYSHLDSTAYLVPSPANGGIFLATELSSAPRTSLNAGNNFFHLVSIDQTSNVGTVAEAFKISVNATPPTISSTSHPSSTTWSTNNNAFFQWTNPVADVNERGFYQVLDHFGRTVPTAADPFLPVTQKQQLMSGLADGVWAFHVVAADTRGYLTTTAGLYRVRIGNDPGTGSVLGTVTRAGSGTPIAGATVTVNNGLFNFAGEAPDQVTNTSGQYSFPAAIPAGGWQVTAMLGGSLVTMPVTVVKGQSTMLNLTLP
jgi:hypothetical protein